MRFFFHWPLVSFFELPRVSYHHFSGNKKCSYGLVKPFGPWGFVFDYGWWYTASKAGYNNSK